MTSVLALGGKLRSRLTATMADRRRRAAVLTAVAVAVTLGLSLLGLAAVERDLDVVGRLRVLSPLPPLLTGLLLWHHQPSHRLGRLMTMYGLLFCVASLGVSRAPWLWVWSRGYDLIIVALFYLVLAHPYGRLVDWPSKVAIGLLFAVSVIFDVTYALFVDPAQLGCTDCSPELNPLLIEHRPEVFTWLIEYLAPVGFGVIGVSCVIVIVHFFRGSSPVRRALLPVLPMIVVSLLLGSVVPLLITGESGDLELLLEVQAKLGSLQELSLNLYPIGIAVGVLWNTKRRQVRVSDLVLALTDVPSADRLQAAVARALGDPSVRVGVWRPEVALYVGPDGLPLDPPVRGSGLDATYLARENGPLAVVVHDESLLDDPGTLASVTAAVRLAVENDRLQEELLEQLREVEASRLRIVEAAYAERRRLERDLHDGAQQRLVSTALALRMARTGVTDPEVAAALSAAGEELTAAIAELRDLARGMYPAVLADEGLSAALQSLADRCPVPTRLGAVPDRRLPAAVEAAAYFVVAEALTNIAKYSDAASADVSAAVDGGWLVLTVSDDGRGGACFSTGGGLAGLRDRLAAFDGTLELTSPRGNGTTLIARLPVPPALSTSSPARPSGVVEVYA